MTDWPDLPLGRKYRCVVIDPPWQYGDALPGNTRGADKQYDGTIGMEQMVSLPVGELLDVDAHVWLWYTNAFFLEAADLLINWRLTPKTQLTWCKPQIGMGHYLRNTTEHAILATRGKSISGDNPKNIPSHFVATRAKHSRKPDEAYDIIRQISPGPYLDVFARSPREGFDRYGNELLQWNGITYVTDRRRFIEHDDEITLYPA